MKKRQALLLTAVCLALMAVAIRLGWKPLMNFLGAKGDLIQSADSLLSVLATLGSLGVAIFSFLSARRKKPEVPAVSPVFPSSHREGGVYIGRDVNIQSGDFVGRDKKFIDEQESSGIQRVRKKAVGPERKAGVKNG